jgi:hypothetical protein
VDRLPGRARVARRSGGRRSRLGRWKVLADDVQAELAQDRGGGLVFEEKLERGPDKLVRGDVPAPEVGGNQPTPNVC